MRLATFALAVLTLLVPVTVPASDLLRPKAIAQTTSAYYFAYENGEVWGYCNGFHHIDNLDIGTPVRDMKRLSTTDKIMILFEDDRLWIADFTNWVEFYCDANRPGHEIVAWDSEQFVMFAYDDGQIWAWLDDELSRMESFEQENPNSSTPPGDLTAPGDLTSIAPNPTSGSCRVALRHNTEGSVSVQVIDVTGRIVRHLLDGPHPPGRYELEWNGLDDVGREVAAGTYFTRIETPDGVRTGRMVVAR